jgi:hypothetical protein
MQSWGKEKLWRGKPRIMCENVLKSMLKEQNMNFGRGWKAQREEFRSEIMRLNFYKKIWYIVTHSRTLT